MEDHKGDKTLKVLTIIVLVLTIVQIIHTLIEFYDKRAKRKETSK